MNQKSSSLKNKCKKIKLVLTDVDGVLTDGGMYYSEKGEILKKFNTRDGMAVELLRNVGIEVIFITREKSKIVLARAKKLKLKGVFIGIKNKESLIPEICKKYKIEKHNLAYIGDDVNDLLIMQQVGFSASPKNGISAVKKHSDYICKTIGGDGVLREIADLILSCNQK